MQQPTDRKQEILQAAYQALKKNGLPALSFDAIAKEADVSRQVVRYYFKDNDTMMVALCDVLAGQYRDTMISGVMQAEGKERLDIFLNFFFDLLDDMPKPRDDQIYDALMSLSTSSAVIQETLRNNYSFLGQVLTNEFAVQYPSLDHQKASELSFLFVCLMYGHWKMVASLGLSEDHKYISRKAMDRLIHSYVNDPTEDVPEVQVWQQ